MAQPTLTEVHVNRPLTDLSLAFVQDSGRFLARSVFPAVAVDKPSNSYFTYDRSYWLKAAAQYRAPGALAAQSGYSISTDTYNALRRALGKSIPDPIRAAADVADLDREAMMYVTAQLMLREELDWVTKYFATSIWGTDATGGSTFTKWNDAASTPIEDIRTGKRTVLTNTGFDPNVLVLGKLAFDRLADHPDIIDRIKYGQTPGAPAVAAQQAMAQLFGVDEVLVATAVQNTAVEEAAGSYSFAVTNDCALLAYRAPRPGLMTASAGYTFVWSGAPGANGAGMRIKSYRDEPHESDVIEGESWYDQKVVSSALGYFFSDAVD